MRVDAHSKCLTWIFPRLGETGGDTGGDGLPQGLRVRMLA